MTQVRYIRYTIRGKGTPNEKRVKLKKPIKMYYSRKYKQWMTIPD